MATLCLLRCNAFGPVERALAAQLGQWFGERVVVAADERDRAVETGALPKLSLTDREVAGLGLHPHHAWPWRCGDYALIAARAAFPEVRRFWLVEPDVFFAVDDIARLFAPMEMSDVDLVAPLYQRSERTWVWTEAMARHLQPVYRCHFPLVRVSAALIDAVAACRREMSAAGPGGEAPAQGWPNDEAVVATVAYARRMRVATIAELCELPELMAAFTYRAHRIWRLSHLRAAGPDGRIYHPAYPERRFIEHLERIADQEPERLGPLLDRLGDSLDGAEALALLDRAAAPAGQRRSTA